MQLKYANAIAVPTGLFAFIAWFGPLVLDLLSLHGIADDISGTVGLFAHPSINWSVIYFWGFLVSLGLIAAINWDLIAKWRKARSVTKRRDWNSTGREAVDYIAARSLFSGPRGKDASVRAGQALAEAAAAGRVGFLAVQADRAAPALIPKRKLRCVAYDYEQNALVSGRRSQKTLYTDVVVDIWEVRTVWPERNGKNTWMGD